jgi:hypothetical protein
MHRYRTWTPTKARSDSEATTGERMVHDPTHKESGEQLVLNGYRLRLRWKVPPGKLLVRRFSHRERFEVSSTSTVSLSTMKRICVGAPLALTRARARNRNRNRNRNRAASRLTESNLSTKSYPPAQISTVFLPASAPAAGPGFTTRSEQPPSIRG